MIRWRLLLLTCKSGAVAGQQKSNSDNRTAARVGRACGPADYRLVHLFSISTPAALIDCSRLHHHQRQVKVLLVPIPCAKPSTSSTSRQLASTHVEGGGARTLRFRWPPSPLALALAPIHLCLPSDRLLRLLCILLQCCIIVECTFTSIGYMVGCSYIVSFILNLSCLHLYRHSPIISCSNFNISAYPPTRIQIASTRLDATGDTPVTNLMFDIFSSR